MFLVTLKGILYRVYIASEKFACFILLPAVGVSNFSSTNTWLADLQDSLFSGNLLPLLVLEDSLLLHMHLCLSIN